jgi:hypothetical protein
MTITFESSGEFKKTSSWLEKLKGDYIYRTLERYGAQGVSALQAATPRDSGETATSWYYEIKKDSGSYSIIWGNRNVVEGTPVAVLIQYGHATGGGGYVQGRDFINPALRPIFDRIAEEAYEEVRMA